MGEFFGVGFNWLGWLTLLAFIGLLGYAAFRGYIFYKIKMDEIKKPKKKRDLPLMVRRRGEKKRYGTYGS
jgi:O-antigen/teichoic acid export membrane protein